MIVNANGEALPAEIEAATSPAAENRGMLLGDFIKAMTVEIGVWPCDGCEGRQEWLNKAHAWLRGA